MKLKQAAIAAVLLAATVPAHAGIMSDLNSMFMSNSTAASTISTRDRVGVFGGSVSMRAPIKAVNLVAFDPPRMNAGCGGIDLYGGSFSFINGQELIAIFRSVASNAAGLAFKAAIKVISPSLDSLITEFQATLQNMNNLAKNSCSLAHLIVDPMEKSISNALDGDGAVGGSINTMFSDAAAGLKAYNANASSFFKKQGEVNPKSGNQVIKAILASGSGATMGLAGLPNSDGSADDATNPNSLNNKILVSILGYEIAGVPCGSQNADGTADTTQNVSANNIGRISCSAPASLSLDDFVKGGGSGSTRPNNPLQLYTCVNPAGAGISNGGFDPQVCTQMKLANFNYEGITGWINSMLFGSPDDSALDPASIMGKVNGGASATFTAAQIRFIHQAGLPIVGLLQKTSNPDARMKIARRLSVPIQDCVAAQLGIAIYKAANGIQNNNTYVLSDSVKKNIDNLRTDYMARQDACVRDRSLLEITQQLNQAAMLTGNNNR